MFPGFSCLAGSGDWTPGAVDGSGIPRKIPLGLRGIPGYKDRRPPPSSSGLGYEILSLGTGVQIPVGVCSFLRVLQTRRREFLFRVDSVIVAVGARALAHRIAGPSRHCRDHLNGRSPPIRTSPLSPAERARAASSTDRVLELDADRQRHRLFGSGRLVQLLQPEPSPLQKRTPDLFGIHPEVGRDEP